MMRWYFLLMLFIILCWNGVIISAQQEGYEILMRTDTGNVIDSEVGAQCIIANMGDPLPAEAHIFLISFDPAMLRVDTSKGINGVEPFTTNTSLVVDSSLPGAIKIEVVFSEHQNLFILHFEPLQTGTSPIEATQVIPDIYNITNAEIKIVNYGDVNGDFSIDIVDALLVAQKYVSIIVDPFIESAANVNCDENIDIIDALLIAQYYVKLIDQFPLCGGTPTPIPTPANPTPEPTPVDPPPFILGDVNGSGTVDIIDCILLTQYISGLNPEPFNEEAADINGDGVIDEADSLLLCYPIYTN